MKNLLFTTIILLTLLSCKAQTLPLFNPPDDFDTNNAYYKDLDGDLTKLVGTWQYSSGSETFKFIIKKADFDFVDLNPERNLSYNEDVLYGEYQYINPSSIEIINTLSNIDDYSDVSEHLIYGNFIKSNTDLPVCDDCFPDERRVRLLIRDPERDYYIYELEIRHIPGDTFGEPEQIKIIIKRSDMAFFPEGEPTDNRLPINQEIILERL